MNIDSIMKELAEYIRMQEEAAAEADGRSVSNYLERRCRH